MFVIYSRTIVWTKKNSPIIKIMNINEEQKTVPLVFLLCSILSVVQCCGCSSVKTAYCGQLTVDCSRECFSYLKFNVVLMALKTLQTCLHGNT